MAPVDGERTWLYSTQATTGLNCSLWFAANLLKHR